MKKGRDFEKLLASIERALTPLGAVIKCPDRLNDIDTGNPREVDATIRHTIGTTNILIAIECRDRSSTDDVTWIEQLVAKRQSIRADKMIAVSSKGFTEPALTKAKREGIDARTLKTIKPKDIKRWLNAITLDVSGVSLISLGGEVTIYATGPEPGNGLEVSYVSNGKWFKVFRQGGAQEKLSLPELFMKELRAKGLNYQENFQDHGPEEIWLDKDYGVGELSIATPNGERLVNHIQVGFELTIRCSNLPLSQFHEYATPTKVLANSAEFSGNVHLRSGAVPIKTTIIFGGNAA